MYAHVLSNKCFTWFVDRLAQALFLLGHVPSIAAYVDCFRYLTRKVDQAAVQWKVINTPRSLQAQGKTATIVCYNSDEEGEEAYEDKKEANRLKGDGHIDLPTDIQRMSVMSTMASENCKEWENEHSCVSSILRKHTGSYIENIIAMHEIQVAFPPRCGSESSSIDGAVVGDEATVLINLLSTDQTTQMKSSAATVAFRKAFGHCSLRKYAILKTIKLFKQQVMEGMSVHV